MSFYSTPKFFKIIQNHELQNGSELRVPKKFVEKYWKGIPNPVEITLPNGAEQELFWVKHDDDIWFNKNWEKISKFLKFGYLVVFKYIGEASFKLKIFGIDCLEIDYSKIKFIDKEVVSDVDESVKPEFDNLSDEFVDETDIAGTSQRRKRGTSKGVNPSFKLTLTTSYAEGSLFRIPCKFSRRYMKGFEGTIRIRRIDEDRTWKMKVKYDSDREYSIVTAGWKSFCCQYNLQTGDVCKFMMTSSNQISFTVSISRARE